MVELPYCKNCLLQGDHLHQNGISGIWTDVFTWQSQTNWGSMVDIALWGRRRKNPCPAMEKPWPLIQNIYLYKLVTSDQNENFLFKKESRYKTNRFFWHKISGLILSVCSFIGWKHCRTEGYGNDSVSCISSCECTMGWALLSARTQTAKSLSGLNSAANKRGLK